MGSRALELDARADLHVAATNRSTADRARSLRPVGGREVDRVIEVTVGSIEIGMVEDIGCVGAELQASSFEEMEGLPEGRILGVDSGSAKRVPPRVAERAVRRCYKGRWIVPLRDTFLPALCRMNNIGIPGPGLGIGVVWPIEGHGKWISVLINRDDGYLPSADYAVKKSILVEEASSLAKGQLIHNAALE